MSKLLLFATFSEAESTIGKLKAIPDLHSYKTVYPDGSIPTLYHYEGGYIALSGMGIHQAMMTIAQYASNIEEIVNFGFAGLLKESEDRPHNLPLGSILKISKVHKYIPHLHLLDPHSQHLTSSIHPSLALSEVDEEYSLVSSDFPIHDEMHKNELKNKYHLVDMEGYGIAQACHFFNKKCTMFKIVSDFCSKEGRELIQNNKKKLSNKLSELVY